MGGHTLDRAVTGWGEMAGCCAHGNELRGFKKCGKFLD